MAATWTDLADKATNDVITAAIWNELLGDLGNLQYLYERGWVLAGSSTTEQTMTSATAGDLVTVSGLSIPATTPFVILINARKSAAAFTPALGLKINTTVVFEAAYGNGPIRFAATNEAQSGTAVLHIGARRTSYLKGIATGTSYMGGASGAQVEVIPQTVQTADFPNATVTDVIIRGDSDGSNTLGVQGVHVYTLGV